MFTRLTFTVPVLGGDWKADGPKFAEALKQWIDGLNGKGVLQLDQVQSLTVLGNTVLGDSSSDVVTFYATPVIYINGSNGTLYERMAVTGDTQNPTTSGSGLTITFGGSGYYGMVGGYGDGTKGGMGFWAGTNSGIPHFYVTDAYITTTVPINRVANVISVANSANIGTTTAYTVPVAGWYRAGWQTTTTRAATTSATLPNARIFWADPDTSVEAFASGEATLDGILLDNVVGAKRVGTMMFYAKAATAIRYSTNNYASVGATTMQYSFRLHVEKVT